MSWGYLVDLRMSLPTASWATLATRTPGELAVGRLGLVDASLEAAFLRPIGVGETFAQILAWTNYHREAIHRVDTEGGTTHVRVCRVLDKSQLDLAYPLVALFDQARGRGATATLLIVNDGTYAGEAGVRWTLDGDAATKEDIDDPWSDAERLGAELYGREAVEAGVSDAFAGRLMDVPEFAGADGGGDEPLLRVPEDVEPLARPLGFRDDASVSPTQRVSATRGEAAPTGGKDTKPSRAKAGKKSAVPRGAHKGAAKKGAAKKGAAKKGAAKKGAAKKGVAKKGAAKKGAAKKGAAKKGAAKKGAAKKSAAKKGAAKKGAAKKGAAKKRRK